MVRPTPRATTYHSRMAKYTAPWGSTVEISPAWTGQNRYEIDRWLCQLNTEDLTPWSSVDGVSYAWRAGPFEELLLLKSAGQIRIPTDCRLIYLGHGELNVVYPQDFEKYKSEDQQEVETWRETLNLDQRFIYHPPTPKQIPLHEEVRAKFRELAEWVARTAPPSDEAKQAIDLIDTALMRTNAAIARHRR